MTAAVIALAGRRVDAASTGPPRFPLSDIPLVRRRLLDIFVQERALAIVSSAAYGADLLALEEAERLGLRGRIVLPFSTERFRETSVVDRPGNGGSFFDRIVAAAQAAGDLVILHPNSTEIRKTPLQISWGPTLLPPMIRPGFLDSESRRDLIELTRDGSAAHRLARRANALVLLDDGVSCEAIGKVLFPDGETIREWHKLYLEDGIEGLATFGWQLPVHGGATGETEDLVRRDPASYDPPGWRLDRK